MPSKGVSQGRRAHDHPPDDRVTGVQRGVIEYDVEDDPIDSRLVEGFSPCRRTRLSILNDVILPAMNPNDDFPQNGQGVESVGIDRDGRLGPDGQV